MMYFIGSRTSVMALIGKTPLQIISDFELETDGKTSPGQSQRIRSGCKNNV